jgi:glutathione S-transferase
MYQLYYAPGAASMCVHQALLEIGAKHELIALDLQHGAQKAPAYLKLNPNGVVPTLLVDGQPMYEAAALLLFLADQHPEAALAPSIGSAARRTYLQWMLHLANTLQPAFRLWFYPAEIAGEAQADLVKAEAQRRIEAAFDRIDAHLSTTGRWMLGEHFSVLDLYAVMLMRWSRNQPRPASDWPSCRGLIERVKARPSWQQLYASEGLTEWA